MDINSLTEAQKKQLASRILGMMANQRVTGRSNTDEDGMLHRNPVMPPQQAEDRENHFMKRSQEIIGDQ